MIGAVLAYLWRRPVLYAHMLVALLVAETSATLLKDAFDRARPPLRYPRPETLVHVPHSSSFPSGHAATAFACATVLTVAGPRRLGVLFYLLAAAIAYSRVYVGVHYPADVVAGAALGTAIGLAVVFGARALPSRGAGPRRSRPTPRTG